jgi:putative MATE family efflux protein
MKLIKDKSFYRNLLAIAIPISLQNLIVFSVSLSDTVMLSHAGQADELVSAASLAGQTLFLLVMVIFGISSGGVVLASQYWGKGDVGTIRKIAAMILQMGIIASALMATAVLLFPSQVMTIFTKEAVVIEKGAEYLSIVGWSYFLIGISLVLMSMLRSIEVVKIALFADITALVISVSLNWVLIFGNLGFPELGIRGAAISTLTARIISFLIFTTYVFLIDKKLKLRIKNIFSFNLPLFKDILKYGFPVLFAQVTWALGMTVSAVIVGHIDYTTGDFIAAYAAIGVIYQLFMVAMFGAANASQIIVGKEIGTGLPGSKENARHKADTLLKIGIMMGFLNCSFILLSRNIIIKAFTFSPETEMLAKELLVYVAFVALIASIAIMTFGGIFRGGGDTRFCMIVEITCMWGVAIPLAALSAFVFTLPVPLVYAAMKSHEFIKIFISLTRIRSGKWVRKLTVDN